MLRQERVGDFPWSLTEKTYRQGKGVNCEAEGDASTISQSTFMMETGKRAEKM